MPGKYLLRTVGTGTFYGCTRENTCENKSKGTYGFPSYQVVNSYLLTLGKFVSTLGKTLRESEYATVVPSRHQ